MIFYNFNNFQETLMYFESKILLNVPKIHNTIWLLLLMEFKISRLLYLFYYSKMNFTLKYREMTIL